LAGIARGDKLNQPRQLRLRRLPPTRTPSTAPDAHSQRLPNAELVIPLPPHQPTIRTDEDTIALLTRLAAHYDDATIAEILNRQGRRSATGERLTKIIVGGPRRYRGIPAHQPAGHPPGELLSVGRDSGAQRVGVRLGRDRHAESVEKTAPLSHGRRTRNGGGAGRSPRPGVDPNVDPGPPGTVLGMDERTVRTAAPESPYDVRHLVAALSRIPGGWLLPSTWRASANLLLWLGTSYLLALIAIVGLLVALMTGWASGLAVALRALTLETLADAIELDRERTRRFSGVRIPSLALAPIYTDASPPARQQAWVTSPLRWRLPAYALTRSLTASAAVVVAAAWWWLTIVWIETDAIAGAVVGVAGVLLWPAVPRAASALDVALSRRLSAWLLGPTTGELSREVDRLSETRAQAVTAADAERRRIERDLHDGFQPQLVNLALNLGLAKSRLATDPEGARALLDRAHEDAKRATEDLRDLVRGIHPSVLDERGLDAAFSALAASSHVRLQIDVHLGERPSREAEGIAYFVVAEAVTNVNKHARARTATITVSEIEGSLRVLVQDDGEGGAHAEPGGGLAGLADRIAAVDGTFSVTSPAGGPTWIEARIPCGR
jgi:signal transduction histidine kinase